MITENMKTNNTKRIAVLPVGEFDTDPVKNEYAAILQAFNRTDNDLMIADPVSNIEGARQSGQELSTKDPDILLIVVLRGLSAETIEAAILAAHLPCVICPVQGRFALPSSALAIGALHETKIPIELLYAPPDHPDFIARLRPIVAAAQSFSRLRKSRIGIIGALFPNLVSCRYDPQVINSRLGVTLLPISFDSVRTSMQTSGGSARALEQAQAQIACEYNVAATDRHALAAGVKLHLALKRLALEQELDGFATECWSGFPRELGLNPCLGFIEDAYALACEGDVLLCISLLIVRYLTGRSAFVGDLFDLDLDRILTLTHCGASASLAKNKSELVLAKSQLALEQGFETLTCRPRLDRGPVTVFRFYGLQCDRLHLASGELISCEQSPSLTARVRINTNRSDFLDQCFGNHYLVVNGDIRAELKLLCKWLGITIFET
jgi:L-fucose isomerase-like protein